MLRDFIVDWKAWSRTERWVAVAFAILIVTLFGWDVTTS
jgi:hypothetical protein